MRLGSIALLASFLPVRGEVPNCARYFSAGLRSYLVTVLVVVRASGQGKE